MKNNNHYCVYDFETDSRDPSTTNPLELAAVMVHGRKNEIIEGSEFRSYIRPEEFNNEGYYEANQETIEWHAKNLGVEPKDILKRIEESPPEKLVFNNFCTYLKKYNINSGPKTKWGAPILCGYNSSRFDDIILERLCGRYGQLDKEGRPKIICPVLKLDLLHSVFLWHESLNYLESRRMDHLREKFDLPQQEGKAHEAMRDVLDEANLLIKMLKIYRYYGQKTRWDSK